MDTAHADADLRKVVLALRYGPGDLDTSHIFKSTRFISRATCTSLNKVNLILAPYEQHPIDPPPRKRKKKKLTQTHINYLCGR